MSRLTQLIHCTGQATETEQLMREFVIGFDFYRVMVLGLRYLREWRVIFTLRYRREIRGELLSRHGSLRQMRFDGK